MNITVIIIEILTMFLVFGFFVFGLLFFLTGSCLQISKESDSRVLNIWKKNTIKNGFM